ncbi:MAG: NADP-dependent oxidoreductase, partial [Hyphomicrobiaceae bacterium]|nr:NADP-dependent oxidoreductase [Hyphomicrobiaceae bacterium]
MSNRVVRLARRPVGMVRREDFTIEDGPVPEPGAGEFRVLIDYISLDPAMRGWMNEGRSYVPPVALGEVMRAYAVGAVEASNNPGFKPGDAVMGLFGVQRYALSNGERVVKVDPAQAPLERWIGGLGMPGWTAYFGLLDVGLPKPGETVVVSAASGAVGSVVGQISKIKGCRAVGIAGGPEKCRYVKEELGFDACVDYKAGNLAADLRAAAPNGIDVYFENVGGDILDTVLAQMNRFGRIPLCGLISGYNATEPPQAPKNLRYVLTQRLKLQGLIVFDWADRVPVAIAQLGAWYKEGRLKIREDVRQGGLDAYPDVLNLLYTSG